MRASGIEGVGATPIHRSAVSRSGLHPGEVIAQSGMARVHEPGECGKFQWEHHLDVRRAELRARHMATARELRLDQVELVADHAFDASLHRLCSVADPPKIEPRHQVQHDGAFGKVHPVQLAHMLVGAPRRHQPAVAVALKQILDDGAGFGQHQISVLNDR